MTTLRAQWKAHVRQQRQYPKGFIGRIIGEHMLRQHVFETRWTVGLLNLQPTDHILEIGFGAGRGLRLVLEQAHQGHVTGVELSATMIQAAVWRNRTAVERGQLTLLQGNVAAPPFKDQQFNKMFTIHTFYFWPDPCAVCTRLVQILAPGGRFVSTFAIANKLPNGEWCYWKAHQMAEAVLNEFERYPNITATLLYIPESRQYNNVAIVIDKF